MGLGEVVPDIENMMVILGEGFFENRQCPLKERQGLSRPIAVEERKAVSLEKSRDRGMVRRQPTFEVPDAGNPKLPCLPGESGLLCAKRLCPHQMDNSMIGGAPRLN